jgi:hypothetical protein
MPTPDETLMPTRDGKLEVNKQYQEEIKIVINLVTASLVLPIVFLKNILGLKPEDIKGSLNPMAYVAWGFLAMSLLACVGFYYFSTKFTKAVYGMYKGDEQQRKTEEERMENRRDLMGYIAAPSALLGLLFLLIFFGSR